MRLALTVVLSLALVAGTEASKPEPAPAKCATPEQYQAQLARAYWYTSAGGNYRVREVEQRKVRRLWKMRHCVRDRGNKIRWQGMKDRAAKRRAEYRFHRKIDRITPFGEWAIPPYIVYCESHGNYHVQNASGAGGAYQIMPGTWAAYGGRRYSASATWAPPWAQHIVAHRIYRASGSGPWSCR